MANRVAHVMAQPQPGHRFDSRRGSLEVGPMHLASAAFACHGGTIAPAERRSRQWKPGTARAQGEMWRTWESLKVFKVGCNTANANTTPQLDRLKAAHPSQHCQHVAFTFVIPHAVACLKAVVSYRLLCLKYWITQPWDALRCQELVYAAANVGILNPQSV